MSEAKEDEKERDKKAAKLREAEALAAKIAATPRKSSPIEDAAAGEVTAPLAERFGEIQIALREAGHEGWLLYDHRGQSPLVARVLGLREEATGAQAPRLPEGRYFYWVPANDMPALVVHEADAEGLPVLPGDVLTYATYAQLRSCLSRIVPRRGSIAMEHSPVGACPDISRVDAGTIELIRGLGATVASSAELVNRFFGPWTELERERHARAHALLVAVSESVLGALSGGEVQESALEEAALSALHRAGLIGPHPRVTSGPHTRRRVHAARGERDRSIGSGDLVLVDLLGRLPRGPFAHLGLTLVRGKADPALRMLFTRVATARDRALAMLQERFEKGTRTLGYEVDRVVVDALGAGRHGRILTRGGHHLGFVPFSGEACTFDDTEIHDTREALVGQAWSLHPALFEAERCMRVQATVRRSEQGLVIFERGPSELVAV